MRIYIISIIVVFIISYPNIIMSYDNIKTHPEITEKAIKQSKVNDFLKSNIGIPEGIGKFYGNDTILRLLRGGSTNEDKPFTRTRHHFWNPLNNSGLHDTGCGMALGWVPFCFIFRGNPNRDWAMGLYEANEYSWEEAKDSYYAALTGTTEEDREENFILMYESLGRVLHLIEDMGVPAHTRNDIFGHLDFTEVEDWWNPISWAGNLYEYHVKDVLRNNKTYIVNLCEENGLTNPVFEKVEDYWDTEAYDGTNPEWTMPVDGSEQAGLAEYCNANFLSECAMFTNHLSLDDEHYFPYPSETSLCSLDFVPRIVTAEDGELDTVLYLDKDKDGDIIQNFVSAKYVWTILDMKSEAEYIEAYKLGFKLDDEVHKAYAEKLIPKTVGYASGVLDYFFRGSIEITLPDDGVYALLDPEPADPTTQGFNHIALMVRNNSSDEELMMTGGSIDLVVKYRISDVDPFQNYSPYPEPSPDVHYLTTSWGAERDIPRDGPVRLEFDLQQEIPLWATDISVQVVYKGELTKGTEDEPIEKNAVCVGFKDISEPTPLDIFNNTDFQCMYDTWCYTDDSLTPNAAEQGYAYAGDILVDECSGDCADTPACEWLFDYIQPKQAENIYIRFSSVDNPKNASANEGEYVYNVNNLEPGRYKRLYVLSDYEFSFDSYAPGLVDKDYMIVNAVKNQEQYDQDSGTMILYYPTFRAIREKEMWIPCYVRNYSIYDTDDCPGIDEERECELTNITIGMEPM